MNYLNATRWRTLPGVIGVAILVASCAASQPLLKETASGYPEGVFANRPLKDVMDGLEESCIERDYEVVAVEEALVTCEAPLPWPLPGMGALYSIMTAPMAPKQVWEINFVASVEGDDVHVTAKNSFEQIFITGEERSTRPDNNDAYNRIQEWLFSLGAE